MLIEMGQEIHQITDTIADKQIDEIDKNAGRLGTISGLDRLGNRIAVLTFNLLEDQQKIQAAIFRLRHWRDGIKLVVPGASLSIDLLRYNLDRPEEEQSWLTPKGLNTLLPVLGVRITAAEIEKQLLECAGDSRYDNQMQFCQIPIFGGPKKHFPDPAGVYLHVSRFLDYGSPRRGHLSLCLSPKKVKTILARL